MIELSNVSKSFTGVQAVVDLSMTIRRGEIFGLLGPNGAGKSTTIRMITNILNPDNGNITYDGRAFDDRVREQIGYLPEERGLYQKARIDEIIVHFAKLKGIDTATAKERASDWLKRFDLGDRQNAKAEELSKGNQQKVQIAIALLHDPEYVVLDEPMAGLDPVNQESLKGIISRLRDSGKTILYSTHQLDIAERLCDRVALINRGRLALTGDVEGIRRRHGGNHVEIDFQGDGAFLEDLPMVRAASIERNRAELLLHDDVPLNLLFPEIRDRVAVERVERVRPSLKQIFIETVGASNVPDEMLAGGAA